MPVERVRTRWGIPEVVRLYEPEFLGLSKPEAFDFLGFTHIAGVSRRGYFQLKRRTFSRRFPLPTPRISHPWPAAPFADR